MLKFKKIQFFILFIWISNITVWTQTVPVNESEYQGIIRVACIGNSVTYGYGIEEREIFSYPAQLQKLLGEKYDVRNFGFSGATMLKKGHKPYWVTQTFKDAIEFKPHVVIIHLGLNDTDPRNWPDYREEFVPDYEAMIDLFQSIDVEPKPRIWICRISPIFSWHKRFKTGTRDYFWEIMAAIDQVSKNKGITLIDLFSALYKRPDLFPDALHPLTEGVGIIAETVKCAITGKYGGLKIPPAFSDHMVLQRDIPITVWGTEDYNEKIEVIMASNKTKCSAGSDGKWEIKLPPLPAGGPYTLTISGQTTLEFTDIMIGEVWLCSGQSNMAFPLKSEENASSEVPRANFPEIRLFNMKPIIRSGNIAFSEEELDEINKGDFFEFGPWKKCTPESSPDFSAVAYYFGKYLYQQLNVPIGLINNAIGGSNTESWISREALESHPWLVDLLTDWRNNDLVSEWCKERANKNLENATIPYQRHPFEPTYLFDAGISPITQYAIRGVIWYQGESNADNIPVHNELFPLLVLDWRNHWKSGNFPFLYVQLSSIEPRKTWPEFRDSQRKFLEKIPNCGMAVTSDIGHPTDVHPKNKKDVGERLALWALAKVYKQDIVFSGPIYKDHVTKQKKVILSFDYTGSRLTTRDHNAITGFEIAGKDGMFKPADAKIKNDRVIVFNKTIQEPFQVRYAWEPFTKANLMNKEGLPASTFITDLNEK